MCTVKALIRLFCSVTIADLRFCWLHAKERTRSLGMWATYMLLDSCYAAWWPEKRKVGMKNYEYCLSHSDFCCLVSCHFYHKIIHFLLGVKSLINMTVLGTVVKAASFNPYLTGRFFCHTLLCMNARLIKLNNGWELSDFFFFFRNLVSNFIGIFVDKWNFVL